jgi:hypothetical protein
MTDETDPALPDIFAVIAREIEESQHSFASIRQLVEQTQLPGISQLLAEQESELAKIREQAVTQRQHLAAFHAFLRKWRAEGKL